MKHFIVSLFLSLSLTGCSLLPWSSDDDSEVLTFLPADQLNQWDLTAKFSVSTAEGTDSGSIRWILNPNEERLDVLSPTGSVVAQLTMTETEARLKTDDRETVAKDAETLFREVMDLSRQWPRFDIGSEALMHRIYHSNQSKKMVKAGLQI